MGKGRLRVSLKWVFSLSLTGLLVVLAVKEETTEDSNCPMEHRIKQIGLEHSEEPTEDLPIWTRSRKETVIPDLETEEGKNLVLPRDRSFNLKAK